MSNYASKQTNKISDFSSIKQHFHTCSFNLKNQKQDLNPSKVAFVKCEPQKFIREKTTYYITSDYTVPTQNETLQSFT